MNPCFIPDSSSGFRILLCVVAHLLLLPALQARAQDDGDKLLSSDLLQPIFPPSAQIQAADSIGDLVLVVWGSTVLEGKDSARNVLWMQLVRGSGKLGEPVLITPPQARPETFVQVLALDGQFLVAWNDSRSGGRRTCLRRVDQSGTVSQEEILYNEYLTSPGALWAWRENGYDLVWNGSGDTILARSFATAGGLVGPVRFMGKGWASRALHPAPLPGTTLLDLGHDGWYILQADGAVEHFTLDSSYHVDAEGRLVVVNGKNIEEYASVIDRQVVRTISAPVPDNTIGPLLVGRTREGRNLIIYRVLEETGSSYKNTSLASYSIVEIAPGTFSPPRLAKSMSLADADQCHRSIVAVNRVGIERACYNRSIVMTCMHISFAANPGCEPDTRSWYDTVTLVFSDTAEFQTYDHGFFADLYDPCMSPPAMGVVRLLDPSQSVVAIANGTAVVRLAAPVALHLMNVQEVEPALARLGDSIILGWRIGGSSPTAIARHWDPSADAVKDIGVFSYGGMREESVVNTAAEAISRTPSHEFKIGNSGGGSAVLVANTSWHGTFLEHEYTWQEYTYYQLTASGWREIQINGRYPWTFPARLGSVVYNPTQRTTLIALKRTDLRADAEWWQLILWDSLGNERWRSDSVPEPFLREPRFVPIHDSEHVVVYTGGARHVHGSRIGEESKAVERLGDVRYPLIKLHGPEIVQPKEISGAGVRLEKIDTGLQGVVAVSPLLVSTRYLPSPLFDFYTFTMVPNPVDSGVIALSADSNGIYMDLFDRHLQPRQQKVLVSRTRKCYAGLTALTAGDSLYVIWRDRRNNVSDIYGRVIRLSGILGVDDTPARSALASSLRVSAAPNPAGGAVVLSWDTPDTGGEASVRAVDMLGRQVAHLVVPATEGSVVWDPADLPAGIYHVMLQIGERRGLCKLVRQ